MTPALPTASSDYGLKGPSADATVDNATSAGLHLSPWQSCPNKRGQLCMQLTAFGDLNLGAKQFFNGMGKRLADISAVSQNTLNSL